MPEIDLSSMQPGDAAAALRSFPRRYRDAARTAATDLDGEPDEAALEEMARRPGPDGWSATDVVTAAADRLADAHDVLTRALVTDTAVPSHLTATPSQVPSGGSGTMEDALGRLDASSTRLAEVVDDADPERWTATLPVDDGGTTTPLQLLQTSVAPVVVWIREVDKVLRAVRGRPRS
ncbi:hypothetical protein GH723_08500 [Actinomarinicola tropica]|uniref:DinB-like domain-containing protein n=1 Tax=Actinomarinicola tropica TaxID=2789776 RepID=A0A5Q2RHX2_9ACTN|nr:hypothetical protein GH723_08500 [Actinomarinicola tropica]